jgi:hypothetical protein
MDTEEIDNDKRIDPEQLDVEWIENSERFHKWAIRAVEAEAAADMAEFEAQQAKDNLTLKILSDPKAFGLEKPTVEAVKAAANAHPEYKDAYREYLFAKAEHNRMKAAVVAMDKKERALSNLVTLHGQEYFAGPTVPHDLVKAWEQYRQRGTERQKQFARKRVHPNGGE